MWVCSIVDTGSEPVISISQNKRKHEWAAAATPRLEVSPEVVTKAGDTKVGARLNIYIFRSASFSRVPTTYVYTNMILYFNVQRPSICDYSCAINTTTNGATCVTASDFFHSFVFWKIKITLCLTCLTPPHVEYNINHSCVCNFILNAYIVVFQVGGRFG